MTERLSRFLAHAPILEPHASADQAVLLISRAALAELARLLEPFADRVAPRMGAEPDPDKRVAIYRDEIKRINSQVDELRDFALAVRFDRPEKEGLKK